MMYEETGTSGSRWVVAVVVAVALMAYPVARWMTGAGGVEAVTQAAAAGTPPAAGAAELQLSFQHYRAGRYQEAITAARATLTANPTSADAYNNLAVSYLGLRQFDEAIQAARDAIRLRPDYQLAKNNLAWIQQEKVKATGPPAPAVPATPAGVLLDQSLQHFRAGRFAECIDTATRSAKLNPHSAPAFNNIGICAGNLQRWDDAVRNTREAIRLDPGFQLAKNNLAWMQQQRALAGRAK